MPILNLNHTNNCMIDGYRLPVGKFKFSRSNDPVYLGRGDWIVAESQSANLKPGTIISMKDQFYMTQMARSMGMIEPHNFSRSIPPRPKKSRVVGERKTKKDDGILVGGFNPFKI